MKMFETFKPTSSLLQRYISYYYMDIADAEDYKNEYICYPHYNNTISLYRSHTAAFNAGHSIISFNPDEKPLQVFTPLRESILKITQKGPVHKIGIVFKPFGVNQFLEKGSPINNLMSSPAFAFFEDEFILNLFEKSNLEDISAALDGALINMLSPKGNTYIERALAYFDSDKSELTIDEIAATIGISRKHLNRLFKKHIGTNAQKYRSIIRFRQLISNKLNKHTEDDFTTLAYRANYADQSHFIRECKSLTGAIPSQFFKEGTIIGTEDTFWKITG